jgi:hypothetical protein
MVWMLGSKGKFLALLRIESRTSNLQPIAIPTALPPASLNSVFMVVKIHIVVFLVMIQYSGRWVSDYMLSQPGRMQYE